LIRTLALYLLVFLMLFGLGYTIHTSIINAQTFDVSFSIFTVYAFHALFSFMLCSIILILGKYQKWQSQLGFLYLAALILKVFFFSIMFSSALFREEALTYPEKLSLLIPVFIFLVPEVYFIARTLGEIDTKNK